MSYVVAAPEFLASAASDLSGIGSSLSAGHAVAAVPTTAVVAAAGDEVSAAVASLFSGHGQAFQALGAQAAAFHDQFVQALNAGAGAYASTEAASAGPLQTLAQGLPVPNMAVSVGGFTLLRSGSATASSEPLTWGHRDRLRRQWHREGHRFF
ncbi:MAG TPA: PE family protein [Mycobacterium sp.]|nr:PE family protein [Mycobacterium sp.]